MNIDEVIEYVKKEAPRFGLTYREGYVSYDDLRYKEIAVISSAGKHRIQIGEYYERPLRGFILDTGFHKIGEKELYDEFQKWIISLFMRDQFSWYVVSSVDYYKTSYPQYQHKPTEITILIADLSQTLRVWEYEDEEYYIKVRKALNETLKIIDSFTHKHGKKYKIRESIELPDDLDEF